MLRNILVIFVLPATAFRLPFLPAKWKHIGVAVTNFRGYMLDQLAHEKGLIEEGKPGSGTLMSNLVRASGARSERGVEYERTGIDERRSLAPCELEAQAPKISHWRSALAMILSIIKRLCG